MLQTSKTPSNLTRRSGTKSSTGDGIEEEDGQLFAPIQPPPPPNASEYQQIAEHVVVERLPSSVYVAFVILMIMVATTIALQGVTLAYVV